MNVVLLIPALLLIAAAFVDGIFVLEKIRRQHSLRRRIRWYC